MPYIVVAMWVAWMAGNFTQTIIHDAKKENENLSIIYKIGVGYDGEIKSCREEK